MMNNPFTTNIFVSSWFSNFKKNKTDWKFKFINGLTFYKPSSWLSLYINAGKNLTKGVHYSLSKNNETDYKGNIYLIYDVPEYFNVNTSPINKSLSINKVAQYQGFLINFDPYNDFSEYMKTTFKKSSRYKFKKYKKRLEQCFDISYKMYYGEIEKKEYDFIFKSFHDLLEKRFEDKKTTNNNLDYDEWAFYYDVVYPMINDKKASLFVIYNGKQPISVTLNYFSEDILFDAITVFDIDYSKFHLGSIAIMKLIEWSIDNDIKHFDFSKGYFDYKKRWSNKEYKFEYHILYDNTSLKARIIAKIVAVFFRTKQYLRDKKLNDKLHRFTYFLKNNRYLKGKRVLSYEFREITEAYKEDDLIEIDFNTIKNKNFKTTIFSFLYLTVENINDIKLFSINKTSEYLIQGKKTKKKIILI